MELTIDVSLLLNTYRRFNMAGFFKSLGNFFTGTPSKYENVSTLRPEQEGLYNNLISAGQKAGAGGAFGQSADYYRNLLSDDSADFNSFAAPQLRQYNEDIVPGLSEQFAGMGSGGLSSSGFRNAQIQGATDLSERLGALRANLRQRGVEGLQNIGQLGLGNFSQNVMTEQGQPGFLSGIANLPSQALASYLGNRQMQSNINSLGGGNVGRRSGPYGQSGPIASPKFQPPRFLQGQGGF